MIRQTSRLPRGLGSVATLVPACRPAASTRAEGYGAVHGDRRMNPSPGGVVVLDLRV